MEVLAGNAEAYPRFKAVAATAVGSLPSEAFPTQPLHFLIATTVTSKSEITLAM
jgi:hypothetical protein